MARDAAGSTSGPGSETKSPQADVQRQAVEALGAALRDARGTGDLSRTTVRMLLGTDEYIRHERRVALTPDQVAQLHADLASIGLTLETWVVRGAGARAEPAFSDDEYAAAGAHLVDVSEVADLPAFDVVHSLKEPTEYEATLQGPFLRIGALHLPTHPPGVCAMLETKRFAAILDGAVVGNCSYLVSGGDRTPIVASMSRFAGAVSGLKVVEGTRAHGLAPGKVVVVGGGVAGRSAIREAKPQTAHLVVIEPWEPMRRRLEAEDLPAMGFTPDQFEIRTRLDDEALEGAIGIVFAHRTGARAAEKVCDEAQIRRMTKGAVIADIAIDQGGSIRHEGYGEDDSAEVARTKYIELFDGDYVYYGEVNMPRERPHEASIHHGIASMPYVTVLLGLCALLGGPDEVTAHLLAGSQRSYGQDEEVPGTFLDALVQDLRNGMPLAVVGGQVTITDTDIEAPLRDWVHRCAG